MVIELTRKITDVSGKCHSLHQAKINPRKIGLRLHILACIDCLPHPHVECPHISPKTFIRSIAKSKPYIADIASEGIFDRLLESITKAHSNCLTVIAVAADDIQTARQKGNTDC